MTTAQLNDQAALKIQEGEKSLKMDNFAFVSPNIYPHKEKKTTGKDCCADFIAPNQSVIIDARTAVYHVARALKSKTPQMIANFLPVANCYTNASDVEVLVSGGVTMDGVTNSHGRLIDIQRAMLRAAGKGIFCLDTIKFGCLPLSRLCDLSAIDLIVTDTGVPSSLLEPFQNAGLNIALAQSRKAKSSRAAPPQTFP